MPKVHQYKSKLHGDRIEYVNKIFVVVNVDIYRAPFRGREFDNAKYDAVLVDEQHVSRGNTKALKYGCHLTEIYVLEGSEEARTVMRHKEVRRRFSKTVAPRTVSKELVFRRSLI
jgi:hypothetical protein